MPFILTLALLWSAMLKPPKKKPDETRQLARLPYSCGIIWQFCGSRIQLYPSGVVGGVEVMGTRGASNDLSTFPFSLSFFFVTKGKAAARRRLCTGEFQAQ
jgi:hypothetical protein